MLSYILESFLIVNLKRKREREKEGGRKARRERKREEEVRRERESWSDVDVEKMCCSHFHFFQLTFPCNEIFCKYQVFQVN